MRLARTFLIKTGHVSLSGHDLIQQGIFLINFLYFNHLLYIFISNRVCKFQSNTYKMATERWMKQLSLTPLSNILVISRLRKNTLKEQYARDQVYSVKNSAASGIQTQGRCR